MLKQWGGKIILKGLIMIFYFTLGLMFEEEYSYHPLTYINLGSASLPSLTFSFYLPHSLLSLKCVKIYVEFNNDKQPLEKRHSRNTIMYFQLHCGIIAAFVLLLLLHLNINK